MNAEQLHDAISALPSDLITEADKYRRAPARPVRWQRYAAMAASFVLVLFSSLWCVRYLGMDRGKDAALEPAAPMEACVEEAAVEAAPAAPVSGMEAAADEAPIVEEKRSEVTAESADSGQNSNTACQAAVPQVTVSGDFEPRELASEERLTLSRLLSGLNYRREDVCECIAEITVTVDGESTFFINLEEGFVRCSRGQAMLTRTQIDTLREILFPAEP